MAVVVFVLVGAVAVPVYILRKRRNGISMMFAQRVLHAVTLQLPRDALTVVAMLRQYNTARQPRHHRQCYTRRRWAK